MNHYKLLSIAVALSCLSAIRSAAQEPENAAEFTRADFVSDASYFVGTWKPPETDYSPQSMAAAGEAFVKSLDDALAKRGALEPANPERKQWTNLPPRPDAGGVRLGELNKQQLEAACRLIAAIVSRPGYQKICEIMLGDDQLLGPQPGRGSPAFGTDHFSIMVFGTPSVTEPWAVQFDGHHIGLNVSIHGEEVALSPSFIGAQPESFEIAGQKFRPFAGEIDHAYELVASLNDDQRRAAVLAPQRGFIRTGPGADGEVPKPEGAECSKFDEGQKKQLRKLIWNWVSLLPPAQAKRRMEQLDDELDEMRFSWNGATGPRSDMSWTIQGPTLIIEFSCQDRPENPLNHTHSMYRDPTREYGRQVETR